MDPNNIVKMDSGNFDSITAVADKLVIVDFWASWCAPCRAIAPILEKLAQEYPDTLMVGKLNIDEQRELAIKYGIASIPTLQLYKNGKLLDTLIGLRPYQYFKDVVDRFI